MLIRTSSVGIPRRTPGIFVASARLNNWCQGDCDFSQQPRLQLSADHSYFEIEGSELLTADEDFKLVIPHFGAEAAAATYAARMDTAINLIGGVHMDRRFDYDPNTSHFWLLASNHRICNQGHWNQNNQYNHSCGALDF